MHQDFLRNAHGLLQSNAVSTFKPTETHLKFKLNNLHQKWSFCLDHFGITLDLPASNLLFAKPFWLPTDWFWASNFPSFRRLWKQCSRWCRTATRRQKSNTRRSKSASSNGDWQEIMDSINWILLGILFPKLATPDMKLEQPSDSMEPIVISNDFWSQWESSPNFPCIIS